MQLACKGRARSNLPRPDCNIWLEEVGQMSCLSPQKTLKWYMGIALGILKNWVSFFLRLSRSTEFDLQGTTRNNKYARLLQ